MKKVFIDGSAGTTGLRIYERLSKRDDIALITLDEAHRKDISSRKAALNEADIAFLCLPDDAAREAVSLIENDSTVVLDTSTAHRTADGWLYGFPELSETFFEKLPKAKRIAVPGCHASGFIALVYPLVEAGILPRDALLTCHSITGYSGGGKKMIGEYEADEISELLCAPRQYALGQTHKHLKEMSALTKLENAPVFSPIVSDFYSGMCVTVPLFASQLADGKGADSIISVYKEKYQGPVVTFCDSAEGGFLSAASLSGKDSMHISVYGNSDRILLTAVYDNLGKGASGAAVECMNYVLGTDPVTGLEI